MQEKLFELLTYLIVYSFLGWMVESVYISILKKKIVNSGFLHGPFCLIYGIGALIMFLFLQGYKENPILIFCLGFVVLSIWEYAVGVFLEKVFKTKYWDYSNNKYNLQGRVCLLNSFFWGMLGILFIYFIHPFIQKQISGIDAKILIVLDITISIYLTIDCIISCVKVLKIEQTLQKIEELNTKIKEKVEELKSIKDSIDKKEKTEYIEKIIEDLKKKQERRKRILYYEAYRLKKAFPTIKSENITKVLSDKVEKIKKHKKDM